MKCKCGNDLVHVNEIEYGVCDACMGGFAKHEYAKLED